jgi:signal transduction histidine kinase
LAETGLWLVWSVALVAAAALLWLLGRRREMRLRQILSRTDQALAQASQALRERDGEMAGLREALVQAEQRLGTRRGEAETYRALLDAAPFPVWRRDGSLGLAWVNSTYARMVEAAPQRIVDRSMELSASLSPEQPRRLAQRALAAGAGVDETRRFVVEGDRRVFRIHEVPLADGGTAGYGQEITALETARTDLAQHIEAHAEVLQSLSIAISIWGQDKRLVLFNRAYATLWQLDEVWLAGRPGYTEVLERLREQRRLPEVIDWSAWRRQQLDLFTAVIEPREEMLHLPDGRTFRATVTPHPFGGLLFAHHDVTDQLILERARNTLIAVQRATLDNLFEGVAVFGSDGRLKLFNKALAQLWRLPSDFLGLQPHVGELGDQERHLLGDATPFWDDFRERILDLVAERQARAGRFDRPDGSVIDFTCMPLPDGALLVTFLDITAAVRVERALRERNEALQAADQLKSEFIANVSYELRTPLNTTLGFAEILHNRYFGDLNERQMEYAKGILDSSHQLLMLINDILDLATIEAGHMVLERDHFDLHNAMEGVFSLVRDRARRQSLDLRFEVPPGIGTIDGDERRIKQVVFNLLNNAIKFTPPAGTITLGAQRDGDRMRLTVRDTGIGIPLEEGRGRRAAQKGRHPGAGLGLPLVRSFVELHGGWVEIDSAPGRGTTVTCHLPVSDAAAPPGRAELVAK